MKDYEPHACNSMGPAAKKKPMDTCDRYALHEAYKQRLKSMMIQFTSDLMEVDDSMAESFCIYEFADKWIEDHIRPAKFEEDGDQV